MQFYCCNAATHDYHQRQMEVEVSVLSKWIVTIQKKGCIDETLMLKWICKIHLKYTKKIAPYLCFTVFMVI